MPEQDPLSPPAAPARLASSGEFAAAIRKTYPGVYDHIQDDHLTHLVLSKYPEYRKHAIDIYEGADEATLPKLPAGAAPGAPPDPNSFMSMGDKAQAFLGDAIASPYTGARKALSGAVEAGKLANARGLSIDAEGGLLGAPPDPPITGPVPPVSVQDAAEPLNKFISGAVEAGELGLIPAAIVAPWATAGALAVGTGAATGAQKGLELAGAPPAVQEIGANVAGLAAGGMFAHGVSAHGARAEAAARAAGEADAAAAAALEQRRAADQHTAAETQMQAELADETARVAREQKAQGLYDDWQKKKDEALASLAVNRGLLELAKAYHDQQVGGRSPFDYLEEANAAARGSLAALDAARAGLPQQTIDPSRMLPQMAETRPVVHAEGPPADYGVGAPPPVPEVRDAAGAPPARTGELVHNLTSAFEESLNRPLIPQVDPATPPVDPFLAEAARRVELKGEVAHDMASLLEDNPFQEEGIIKLPGLDEHGGQTEVYNPRVPSAKVFRSIVGEENQNPPAVSLITDILRVWADTGATDSKSIPGARLLKLRQAKGYGPREFTNAYDRWMPEVLRVQEEMTTSKLAQERRMEAYRAQEMADAVERGRLVPGSKPVVEEGLEPGVLESGAPPAPPDDMGDMPPDWLNEVLETPEGETTPPVEGGEVPKSVQGEADVPLPGLEGVRATENPTPQEELPFSLSRETGPGSDVAPETRFSDWWTGQGKSMKEYYDLPADQRRAILKDFSATKRDEPATLWDALKSDARRLLGEEEGSLRVTADLNDEAAVRRWLNAKAKEYGHESWHEAATQALEEGDLPSAARIISIAAARANAADLAAAQARKQQDPAAAAKAADISDAIERTRQAHRAQIEAQLGMALPKSVDVSPEGILTFQPSGKGVPALKARATDLTLAKTLADDITQGADATQIIRLGTSDEVPKQFQISKQIADQTVREMDPNVVADLADLMGFGDRPESEQRLEIARQYSRAYSQAGKLLGELGRWTQENADLFYEYGPVNETGKIGELGSVGALQGSGIVDADGFVRWLGKAATPEQLAEMKFEPPRGIELKNSKGELTPEARVYARNWFSRQQRIHEVQTTIDRLVGEQGNALDRALAATTIAPQLASDGQGRLGAFNSLTKAALISRPGTMIRNAISQSGRYASGMADEALASFYSLATGNTPQATLHARNMRYLVQGLTRKGTSSLNLFKHPWAEGLQAIYNFGEATIANLPPGDARKTLALLSEVPHEEARMLGSLALEGIKPDAPGTRSKYRVLSGLQAGIDQATRPEVRNTITLLNRVQEHFFRASVFDAMMRAQIEARGLDPMEMLAGDPRQLIDKVGAEEFDRMAGAAVSTALDYTFAADPLPGTAPAMLLNVFQKTPVLSFLLQLGVPFPRFNFVSAPRWVWDHTPVAPVGDLMLLGLSHLRTDASPAFRGRFYQMMQARRMEATMLDLDAQIGRANYDAAQHLSNFMSAKEGQRQAATVLKALDAREAKGASILPEDLTAIRAEQAAAQQRAVEARAKWREADVRARNLTNQRERAKRTAKDLTAVGAAKSPQEYFARVTTGTMMLAAGYAFAKWKQDNSSLPGSSDSQWYEMPTDWIPKEPREWASLDNRTIDLRAFAPEIQHFFMPDVLADVESHTDWSELDPKQLGDLHYVSDYMSKHYTGKYTSQKFTKEALEAYLTISPAAGSTRDLMDILTGRSESGNGGLDPGALQDVLISMAGQFVGRLTAPLTPISDVVGQFDYEESKARIPREGTPENHSIVQELTDPALANIPFARRAIPEKVDALSGSAVATVDPLARQFGAVTKRVRNKVAQEMNATGLSYSQVVPRQTGDREFDNAVNRAYSALLNQYFPAVLEDETYQSLTPELRRDVLANGIPGQSGVFPRLKKMAIQAAIEKLGKDPATLRSPDSQARIDRWQRYADQMNQELEPEVAESQRTLEQESQQQGRDFEQAIPEPGAPPGLP